MLRDCASEHNLVVIGSSWVDGGGGTLDRRSTFNVGAMVMTLSAIRWWWYGPGSLCL